MHKDRHGVSSLTGFPAATHEQDYAVAQDLKLGLVLRTNNFEEEFQQFMKLEY